MIEITDNYEIIRCIGKGAFGKVYKVYDAREKKYIAVKVVEYKDEEDLD